MPDPAPHHGAVRCRAMIPDEAPAVLHLVMRGFDEHVRPDFSARGAAAFEQAARSFVLGRPAAHEITVAEQQGELAGMIDVRDYSHISLFFVDPERLGRGIGRQLLVFAADRCRRVKPGLDRLTVNSSPWAVDVYRRLGFVSTGPEDVRDGIRFTPMTWIC